jgi:hypothetical protein
MGVAQEPEIYQQGIEQLAIQCDKCLGCGRDYWRSIGLALQINLKLLLLNVQIKYLSFRIASIFLSDSPILKKQVI